MGNLKVEEVGVEQVLGLPVTVHVKNDDEEASESQRNGTQNLRIASEEWCR